MEQQHVVHGEIRQALIVVGMHRSGTSAVARAANLLGFSVAQKLMPAKDDNPAGFWESINAVRISQRVLTHLSRDWDDPRPIYPLQFQAGRLLELRRAAHQFLESDFPGVSSITLKDPRFSRLIPFWDLALRERGFTPHYLYVYRNPIDVGHSLKVRNRMTSEQAQQLWLAHLLEALDGLVGKSTAFLSFDELVNRRDRALGVALEQLGLSQQQDRLEAACIDLKPELRHSTTATERLLASPDYSSMVKECYVSLRLASQRPELAWQDCDQRLKRWRDAWEVLSPARSRLFFSTEPQLAAPNVRPTKAAKPRAVIMHYHIFKNAGSSVDTILKGNFRNRWREREFSPVNAPSTVAEVGSWIAMEEEADAFSSHTAALPPPEIDDVDVLPIVFIRHPLARIRSAYEFERKQKASTLGARLAKEHDFVGYVVNRNTTPRDRQCKDLQCSRLAKLVPETNGSEAERARLGLASLPFFGLVECFDQSIGKLESWLKPRFPTFRAQYVHANASSTDRELGPKLDKIRAELGSELYAELARANSGDLMLFEFAAAAYGYKGYPT